jgi:hypothetical protein
MSDQARGTFSCRIDGRAGYLRLFDDRIELVRSGRRGPRVLGPEVIPMHLITHVVVGKPGRLLTAVELIAAGAYLELKFPSIDAPRVADLIELLMLHAVAPVDEYVAVEQFIPVEAYVPVEAFISAIPDLVIPEIVMPAWTPLPETEELGHELDAAPALTIPEVDMPTWTPPETELLYELDATPALTIPKVDMPTWTPLPETDLPDTDLPEVVLSQIVLEELAPVVAALPEHAPTAEPVLETAPLPEGSVLAAAAALAELEDMLRQIEPASPPAEVLENDDPVENVLEVLTPIVGDSTIPAQPSNVAPERPVELTPELSRRLSRLEVLRNSGVMSEADFAVCESELLESHWAEAKSA